MEAASVRAVRFGQALADHLEEFLEIERLEDGIAYGVGWDFVHAALSGGCEHHDVGASSVGIIGLDLVHEFVTVDLRHHQIEEDQIDFAVALQFLESYRPILGQRDIEFHALEDGLKKYADGQIVVDDEYFAAVSVDLTDHSRQRFNLLRDTYRADA